MPHFRALTGKFPADHNREFFEAEQGINWARTGINREWNGSIVWDRRRSKGREAEAAELKEFTTQMLLYQLLLCRIRGACPSTDGRHVADGEVAVGRSLHAEVGFPETGEAPTPSRLGVALSAADPLGGERRCIRS